MSRIRPPGPVEVNRWAELLDYEAQLRDPQPVALLIPLALSEPARRVAEAMRLMLGLRHEMWEAEPFTFSRRYTQALTGLSEDLAKRALRELRDGHVIVLEGKTGFGMRAPNSYRLGTPREVGAVPVTEDSLVNFLMAEFAATELDRAQENRR
jgi:hypothetical protein